LAEVRGDAIQALALVGGKVPLPACRPGDKRVGIRVTIRDTGA
jgi:hypothetical protein